MKERPIIFSGPMILAILNGLKTQTRRVVKPQPTDGRLWPDEGSHRIWGEDNRSLVPCGWCPYGQPGDRLWVRETWGPCEGGFCYRASEGPNVKPDDGKWHPSIHMFREASRLTLEIVEIRVERLQEITDKDAKAEGTCGVACTQWGMPNFQWLWESINGKTYPWHSNPWVWVVEFKKMPYENKPNPLLQAASESGNPVRPVIKANIEEVSPT